VITIGLSIIAKDEKDALLNIISKYSQYFDEICIAIDDKKVYEELNNPSEKVKVFHYDHRNKWGLLDFAHKRNFIMGKANTDYIFRLDTDDEILNPEKIKDTLDFCIKEKITVLTMRYDYFKDEWGNTNLSHYRETILLNDGNLFWNKPIHECVLPIKTEFFKVARDESIVIKHNIDKTHSDESQLRNIKYLIKEYEEDKEDTDPRTLAYLGRAFMGIGDWDKARYFLEQHIKKSGWDDDRYLSWCQIAHCLRVTGNLENAKGAVMEALLEKPDFPDAYFELHDIYFTEGKWEKALEFGRMGFEKPIPKTNVPIDPSAYTFRPMLSMAMCYYQIGEFRRAKNLFDRAKVLAPTLGWVKDNEKMFEDSVRHQEYIEHLIGVARLIRKDDKLMRSLAESIPEELYEHDIAAGIRSSYLPPPIYGKNSVVIYCGSTAEEWSPKSVEKGIGGSEEAVIRLSKELYKLGYDVEVYNNCGENAGVYEGVKYINFVKFNQKGKYNILISWRQNIFKLMVNARNKIVWIHDVPRNIDWGDDNTLIQVDKFVVLSEYHRSLLPKNIPQEKIFITTNGIDPDDFKGMGFIERDPKRIIYASSYDRGLEEILNKWKDIIKEVPEASLHIYYGWDTYDFYVKNGWLKEEGFKARMLEKMKQPNVFEHGRIGHKELAKEYFKAGVFAYPSKYVGEINCIALTKAVASGCIAVTNDYAVLKERNPHVLTTNEKFFDTLIDVLKNSANVSLNRTDYIEKNSWKQVAIDWHTRLFPLPMETECIHRVDWARKFFNKDQKIIDIGANDGHDFGGWDRKNITSVDIDEYDYEGFVKADASDLPFPDKSFDIALLAEIVEHTKNPIKVLSEAKRVAKKVIITVPYEFEWWKEIEPLQKFEDKKKQKDFEKGIKERNAVKKFYDDGYKHLFHEIFYTPELLKEHLEKAGYKNFKITKLRDCEWVWFGVECLE